MAVPVLVQGTADQVIGLVVMMGQHHQAQRGAQCLAVHELALECFRRRVAVGLVGRVQAVAEAAVERFVEGDGDVPRALALKQVQQEAGKAVHGVGRPALCIQELGRQRMPGAEHIDAGINQVQRGRRCRQGHAGGGQ
ncbi:hypothetical protein G6F32_015134 [Rhizopus arrhizus]|nr:hypothetical protein G6F32_015134 [Rhizopus arrhizus]